MKEQESRLEKLDREGWHDDRNLLCDGRKTKMTVRGPSREKNSSWPPRAWDGGYEPRERWTKQRIRDWQRTIQSTWSGVLLDWKHRSSWHIEKRTILVYESTSRMVALLLPYLPLHVQINCFLIFKNRSFRISHDPNVFFSFLLLTSSSANTIIAHIISRVSSIPLGKSPYACDNLHKSADDITG